MSTKRNICILGCGNVGVAIAADLSIKGHDVTMIKTSQRNSRVFDKIRQNDNRVYLKEGGRYHEARISDVTYDLSKVADADIIFVTVQSTYHEDVIKSVRAYLNSNQIVVVICSYMSLFFFFKYCEDDMPTIVEAAGPYLEGRVEESDTPGEIVFRVGCRLTRSPMSMWTSKERTQELTRLHELYNGFSDDYAFVESALLNPNLVLHTVGAVMSIPRIEYSDGDFCMYREAYSRKNPSTVQIMLELDKEKCAVLQHLGYKPTDIFEAGGFLGDPLDSFYAYSESSDRALSPTSVQSRYITEDVPQGLVLLESIAQSIGIPVPITSSIISIAGAALGRDMRKEGRTIQKLGAESYICKNLI